MKKIDEDKFIEKIEELYEKSRNVIDILYLFVDEEVGKTDVAVAMSDFKNVIAKIERELKK